jgi:aspartyl-tRNA(Asn)/glutamyl-tRNA(Gln) amidotransferase subunit B
MTQTICSHEYDVVIGLEVHAELATRTKAFCGCSTQFGADPNTQTCQICLGFPGVLPVLNREAVEKSLQVALALQCEISNPSIFERKNYYYPDLPKNYQISQRRHPLGVNGKLEITVGEQTKLVNISDVHLEEDAGKLLHPETGDSITLVDLNRSGIPLLEIVSAPDMNNGEEVAAYMEEIRRLLQYLGASEAKMEQGQIRFEVNISLCPKGAKEYGTRVEIKNLNSFRAVSRTLEYEIQRQAELLDNGGKVDQETRLWDDAKEITMTMRRKEVAHDYRYFPEPDLVPLVIDKEWIERAQESLPELPTAKRSRFIVEYELTENDIRLLTEDLTLADYFEQVVLKGAEPKAAANWINGRLARRRNESNLAPGDIPIPAEHLAELIHLADKGAISATAAREVFDQIFKTGEKPSVVVEKSGLAQIGDADIITEAAQAVLAKNAGAIEKYRAGNEKVLAFLTGQVMKETRGRADAQKVQEILKKLLSE